MNKKLVLAVALTVATSFNAMGADVKVAPQAEALTVATSFNAMGADVKVAPQAEALTVATSFNAMGADVKVAPQAEAATAEKTAPQAEAATAEKTDWLTVGMIQANKITNKLRSFIRIKQAGEEAKFYIADVRLDVTKPVVKEMVKEAEDKLTPEAK